MRWWSHRVPAADRKRDDPEVRNTRMDTGGHLSRTRVVWRWCDKNDLPSPEEGEFPADAVLLSYSERPLGGIRSSEAE